MNGYIKRSAWFIVIPLACVTLALSAQAASFDCTKAQSKVEHIICDNPEISKLDDELATSYKAALRDHAQAGKIKQAQKQWMKERNICVDAGCLNSVYRDRIGKLTGTPSAAGTPAQTWATPQAVQQEKVRADLVKAESYTLLMSKDDELCNHMLQLFNEDLKKYGWNGDAHQEEHEEFKRVPWQPARFSFDYYGHAQYSDVQGALFDLNNDGVPDFVVRETGSLSNARADSLYMLDAETANRANELTSNDLLNTKDQISLAGYGYFYDQIAHLSEMDTYPQAFDPRVLEPFIYHGTSYLVMRNLFEDVQIRTGYAVIAKYGAGKFVARDVTGRMENICYFKRTGTRRAP